MLLTGLRGGFHPSPLDFDTHGVYNHGTLHNCTILSWRATVPENVLIPTMVGIKLYLFALDITLRGEVVQLVEHRVHTVEACALLAPEVVVGRLPVPVTARADPPPAVGFIVDVDPCSHRVLVVGVSALIPNPWPE